MALRKKVVVLETAESDNERLRKELTRLRIKTQEEQSKFELDFMNQLSEVARENATKMDLITDELRETKQKNHALTEQLRSRGPTPINGSDPRFAEVGSLKRQLQDAKQARDDLVKKLDDRTRTLRELKKEFETQSATEMKLMEDENKSLKTTIASLEKEKEEMKVTLSDIKSRQATSDNKKDETIADLQKEIQVLKSSAQRIENESRDLTNGSRNDDSAEQVQEARRSPPRSRAHSPPQQQNEMGGRQKFASRIMEKLEQTKSTLGEEERMNSLALKNETKISDLEAELSSTKDLLAHEKDLYTAQERELNTKMQALHETLYRSENSRAALVLDNERLIAQANQITEENIQLEQKSKRQHQQLKQLEELVEEHLHKVDKNRKDDAEMRDQVESLTRELLHAQEQISHLQKTIEKKRENESTTEHLAKLNLNSVQTQLNKLQNEVTLRDTKLSEAELRHKKEIISLETALDSAQLDLKESVEEIEKYKVLAEEKMNEARTLERGKEQLILSMQDMVKNTRHEVDDYQNELVEMNSRLTNETRRVSSLRSKLERSDYPAKEMGRLRKRNAELSRQLAMQKESEMPPEHENRQLRIRLKEALAQRSQAEERLQRYLSERGANGVPSKPVQVLRQRNAALKNEVEHLTRKVEKLSGKLSGDSSWDESKPYVVKKGVTRMMI